MASKAPVSRIKQDHRDVFDNVKGRRVLVNLAKISYRVRTAEVDLNPQALAYHEGMRYVLKYFLRQLNKSDAEMLGLIEEGIMEKTTHE